MTDLTGKTALVTGSVQGIGLAIAHALAGADARIAVHGIAGDVEIEEACAQLKAAGSPQAEFFAGDFGGAVLSALVNAQFLRLLFQNFHDFDPHRRGRCRLQTILQSVIAARLRY